jgi:hypothetical protein
VEAAEAPRPESAEREDFERVAMVAGAGLFVSLCLPWFGSVSGWAFSVGAEAGLLALAVVLLELLRVTGSWATRAAQLLAFCLTAAAGIMGVTTFVTYRWGAGATIGFSTLRYGAWIGLAAGVLLLFVAVAKVNAVRRPAP